MIKIHPQLLNFVRPSDHSKFSPSSMDRIIACGFSVEPSQKIPSISSFYSEEGTCAHSVCEATFAEEFYMIPFPAELKMKMLQYDHQEMTDCAHTYVDVLQYWLNNYNELGEILFFGLERGIPIFPEDGCFGTADMLIVGTKGSAIIDYKHGKGKNVSADSIQLRSYAAGVARHLSDVPEDYRYFSIVVQPRTDPAPKVASYSHDDMMDHLKVIHEAIMVSRQPGLYPVEGSHCWFCPLKQTKDPALKCPAIKNKAFEMASQDFGKFLSDMNAPVANLKDENKKRDAALIKIISLLPLMQQIAKDGQDEFTLRIEKGEKIEGLQIVQKEGNRAWVHSDDAVMSESIKALFPQVETFKDIPATRKLKTITEIEKIVGKDKATILTVRPISKKLSIVDSKIQEVLGEMAAYGNLLTGNFENND